MIGWLFLEGGLNSNQKLKLTWGEKRGFAY
jgi:hypothetical protein